MIQGFKKLLGVFWTLIGFFSKSLVYGLVENDEILLRRRRAALSNRTAVKMLRHLGVELTEESKKQDFAENCFFVSNHLSYIDVVALLTILPSPVFVTSKEIEEAFFLGWIIKMGGAMGVERRNQAAIRRDINRLKTYLEGGLSVVVFPEATSSNGSEVLPFKRALLEAAFQTEAKLQPLCLNYKQIDGRPLEGSQADDVFWYGEMYFFPHLWRLLKHKRVDLEIKALEPISMASVSGSKELAKLAYDQVNATYCPVERLPEKKEALDLQATKIKAKR